MLARGREILAGAVLVKSPLAAGSVTAVSVLDGRDDLCKGVGNIVERVLDIWIYGLEMSQRHLPDG